MSIAENLRLIQRRIDLVCSKSNRSPNDVRLVAVSKTQPATKIIEAIRAGIRDFGENYAQEGEAKIRELDSILAQERLNAELRWHFIGGLQSNKAALTVGKFDWIHSLDRASLANEIAKSVSHLNAKIKLLVQVNLDEEDTKSGLPPTELLRFLETCLELPQLDICGLTCIPKPTSSKDDSRRAFARLRELRDRAEGRGFYNGRLRELSMGMSNDFEEAIAEGATIIRIGTALFGERS